VALLAASCGGDDDSSSEDDTAGASAATSQSATPQSATGTVEAAPATTGETDVAVTSGDSAGATGDVTADDAVDGVGAEAWEATLRAAEEQPLQAEGEEIVIAMPNVEGSPAGSFPDIREGAQAAVQFINEKLGGVGADVAAGTPGRPLRLEVCAHQVDQSEAQACATEVQEANPSLIVVGIDFFTPLMYPVWQGIPTIETVPIFTADFDQPGVLSAFGGCVTEFPGQVLYDDEILKADRVALIVQDLAPSQECLKDTQQPFYDSLGLDYEVFTDKTGDPSDNDANIQAIQNYLDGAESPVINAGFGAADCAEYLKGLATAGNTAQIVVAGSCLDASVLQDPSAEGVAFGFQNYIVDQPDLYSPFVQYELTQREQALNDFGPESPLSTFMRTAFSAVAWGYQAMNEVAASGGDPSDRAAIAEALAGAENSHIVGYPPVNCVDVAPNYRSICRQTITFARWDGTQFVPDPELGGEYLDLSELLASAPPRD
jgi:hypothetical protein